MTTRERLHALIDELPDDQLGRALSRLEELRPSTPIDDESFTEAINAFVGSFSAEDYPYWATPEKVLEWIRDIRSGRDVIVDSADLAQK